MHKEEPDKVIVARMGSPIVLGVGEGEHFVASDPTPLLPHTRNMIFLDDGEMAEVTKTKVEIFNLKDQEVHKQIEHIDWNDERAEKQGYPHFMLKEIFDQPAVFEDAIRGRLDCENGTAKLGGLNMTSEEIRQVERVVLIACGTAYHAGLIGKYLFEDLLPRQLNLFLRCCLYLLYEWEFVFLGANIDSFDAGYSLNINAMSTSNYEATSKGVGMSYHALNTVIRRHRAGPCGQSVSFTDEERKAMNSPKTNATKPRSKSKKVKV